MCIALLESVGILLTSTRLEQLCLRIEEHDSYCSHKSKRCYILLRNDVISVVIIVKNGPFYIRSFYLQHVPKWL
jgi:hypothetical protein